MNIKKETLIRTIITAITLINSLLIMGDKNPLPWSEEDMYVGLSTLAALLTTIWSWWKNNSFTKAAIQADEFKAKLKEELL